MGEYIYSQKKQKMVVLQFWTPITKVKLVRFNYRLYFKYLQNKTPKIYSTTYIYERETSNSLNKISQEPNLN